jgi:hypothetical protein
MNEAFLTSIDETIVNDAGIEVLCDGFPRLFLNMAGRESPFPYMVHTLKGELDDDGITTRGTYLIDVWDCGDTAERAWHIARLLKILLHETHDMELNNAGLNFEGWDGITTDDPEIWRVALRFEAWWPDTDLA